MECLWYYDSCENKYKICEYVSTILYRVVKVFRLSPYELNLEVNTFYLGI